MCLGAFLFFTTMELKAIILYLLVINIITFIAYARDKHLAKKANARRIPEKNLILLAVIGGSIGALLAMRILRHKTLHKKFYIGIPVILALQIIAALFFLKN